MNPTKSTNNIINTIIMYVVIHRGSGKEISYHESLQATLAAIEALAAIDGCSEDEFDWKFDENSIDYGN